MPKSSSPGGGQWGLSWNDLQQAEQEYSVLHRCRIEWRAAWVRYGPASSRCHLAVVCEAVSGREGPSRVIGYGACQLGGNKGAASATGAYLRSMIDACADLEERRTSPRYNRDTAPLALPE